MGAACMGCCSMDAPQNSQNRMLSGTVDLQFGHVIYTTPLTHHCNRTLKICQQRNISRFSHHITIVSPCNHPRRLTFLVNCIYNMYNEYDVIDRVMKNFVCVEIASNINIDLNKQQNIIDNIKIKPNYYWLMYCERPYQQIVKPNC